MVSAKFHIVGEEGEWFRVRLQEEVFSHGLEGNVVSADDKTLVVVVDGDKSRVKRFYSDVGEFLPEGVERGELHFSLQRKTRGWRIKHPSGEFDSTTLDYILQYLKEIEKTTQRINQKVNTLVAMHEGYAGSEILSRSSVRQYADETFEEKDMEVEDEASSGFASMFGD